MGPLGRKVSINTQDFYGFVAQKLQEAALRQPLKERNDLPNTIMNAFLKRTGRQEDLAQKLDKRHKWIIDAIKEGQETWAQTHNGNKPMDLLKGEFAPNLLNLENALTGNTPENFSGSGELLRK